LFSAAVNGWQLGVVSQFEFQARINPRAALL